MLGKEIGILSGVLWSIDIAKKVEKLFKEARLIAKETGKILAIALANGWPFIKQTVSLVGFSLGGQVIKSCIKCLHKLGVKDVV